MQWTHRQTLLTFPVVITEMRHLAQTALPIRRGPASEHRRGRSHTVHIRASSHPWFRKDFLSLASALKPVRPAVTDTADTCTAHTEEGARSMRPGSQSRPGGTAAAAKLRLCCETAQAREGCPAGPDMAIPLPQSPQNRRTPLPPRHFTSVSTFLAFLFLFSPGTLRSLGDIIKPQGRPWCPWSDSQQH